LNAKKYVRLLCVLNAVFSHIIHCMASINSHDVVPPLWPTKLNKFYCIFSKLYDETNVP